MRRPWGVGLVVILVLASAALGQNDDFPDEPKFRGMVFSHWLTELKSADASERRAAVEALGLPDDWATWWRFHAEARLAVPPLRTALGDPDPAVQTQAALSLVALDVDYPAVTALVTAALRSPDAALRLRAVAVLKGRKALPALRVALRDPDQKVRLRAAEIVARIAPEDAGDVLLREGLQLPQTIDFGELPVRQMAWRTLARANPNAVPTLVAALEGPTSNMLAALTLAAIGPPAARAALPALRNWRLRTPEAHERNCLLLVELTIDPGLLPEALPLLIADLKEAGDEARSLAMGMLIQMGPKAAAVVPTLLERTRREMGWDQLGIFMALGHVGPGAKETLPALVKLLESANIHERLGAISALQIMGPLAKPAIPALRRALKDPGDGVPVLAAEALVRIDPRLAIEVVPSLATNLQRHHLVGSREICALLATLGPAAKEAVPALRQAAREGEVYDRLPALAALMQVDPTEARAFVPDLAAALRNPKVGLRCDAAWLLGQKGAAARAAVPDLIAALNEPGLRIPAAWALGRIGPAAKDAVPALLAAFQGAAPADPPEAEVATAVRAILAVMAEADPLLLEGVTNGGFGTPIQAEDIFAVREGRDPEPTVFRRVAAFALGGIGTDSPDVRQALLAARRDADPHLRLQGAVALARVAPTMAPDVMPGLRAALRDQHPGVRAEAAWTLAMVGPLAQEVVAELEALRQDTTLRVRNAANQTLRTFGR